MEQIFVHIGGEFYYADYEGKHIAAAQVALKAYVDKLLSQISQANATMQSLSAIGQTGCPVLHAAIAAADAAYDEIRREFAEQTKGIVVVDVYVDHDVRGNSTSTVRYDRCGVKVD